MNNVFVSGIIATAPILKKETETIPHLVFSLGTRHKTRTGKLKYEKYTVNAWNHVALWGASNLEVGQPLTVQGYLTQRIVKMDDLSFVMTEITAEKFILNAYTPMAKSTSKGSPISIPQEEIGADCIASNAVQTTTGTDDADA